MPPIVRGDSGNNRAKKPLNPEGRIRAMPPVSSSRSANPRIAALAFAALLAGCGGGGGTSETAPPPPSTPPVDIQVTGLAVVKVRSGSQGVTAMEETLVPLGDPGPRRMLALFDAGGIRIGSYVPPAGSSLIDFARHPSGETTAILATNRTVTLVRLDGSGLPIDETPLADPLAAGDPYYDAGGLKDDGSMVPLFARDASSVAQIGEEVAVALRTGRNAVVAYRFRHRRPDGYSLAWRTLVEPGLSMFGVGITSGTFDTYGQLENHWHVHLDADAAGNIVVGVIGRTGIAPVFAAHADHFAQPIALQNGLLLTRLDPDGRRLGTTPIDTTQVSELHGLRLAGDDVGLVGRVFSEKRPDGTGWNAYVAHIDRASGAARSYRTVDVDAGEILFDIQPLGAGRFLVAGAAGYAENPDGASISESGGPLLAVLESDGTLRQRLAFPSGPRQNPIRTLEPRGSKWLVGGMMNGPGTHSGDADRSLIRADGYVNEIATPAP
jgi:hypothetical protein